MFGDAFDSRLDLSGFGAPGFELRERLDLSGHASGRVVPHVNAEVLNSRDEVVARDLASNQLDGFNILVNGK